MDLDRRRGGKLQGNEKKLITEKQCLAHFIRERDNIVTNDATRTGREIPLANTNRQHNPTNSIRHHTFEQRREELFNGRVRIIRSGMGIREISFQLIR